MIHITLPIKRRWFDMIASGEKKEEYRDVTPYYRTRLKNYENYLRAKQPEPVSITFRNGYGKVVPEVEVIITGIRIGQGKPEWGAEEGKEYYVLELGAIAYCSQNYCERCGERTEPEVDVCEGCF